MLRFKRWLAVGFITVTIILVVQILDRSNLDRPNKLQENTSITAQDHQGPEKRIKLDIETIRAKRINVLAEEGRTFSANRSKAIFNRPLELSSIWREIKTLGDNVSLYPANYNVEKVRWALQTAKIISAEKTHGNTALKWTMVLDGNQRVVFKPSLQSRRLETSTSGQYGCEYPEYEITGFALTRMLDLRNMPFTVGRKLNWFTDIAPVAGASLTASVKITQDCDMCMLWRCAGSKKHKTYCFPKGDITGSVMVWLDQTIQREVPKRTCGHWTLYHPMENRTMCLRTHHVKRLELMASEVFNKVNKLSSECIQDLINIKISPYDFRGFLIQKGSEYDQSNHLSLPLQDDCKTRMAINHHNLLPGDDSFCKWFRTTGSYKDDGRFVAILDIAVMNYIMSSSDSKDTFIINDKNEKVNVFIDLGKSFYPEQLLLIAPIYQCCKIRKKVYDALIKLQYNFEEAFNDETKTDQLYPVLDFGELNAMKTRIHTILKFVEMCHYSFGKSSVYLNI